MVIDFLSIWTSPFSFSLNSVFLPTYWMSVVEPDNLSQIPKTLAITTQTEHHDTVTITEIIFYCHWYLMYTLSETLVVYLHGFMDWAAAIWFADWKTIWMGKGSGNPEKKMVKVFFLFNLLDDSEHIPFHFSFHFSFSSHFYI